jgi:cobaltochelatase CobN
VTQRYVGADEVRDFLRRSNPWALRAIAERLLEASERGLWNARDASLELLRDAYLEVEGELEEASA